MRFRRVRRSGLTLIEMVLTFAIGMLILLAVFMVMQTQYTHTEAGREALEEATVARNILNRIAADLSNSLSATDARFLPVGIIPNNANIGVKTVPPGGSMAAMQAAANNGSSGTGSGTTTTVNSMTTTSTGATVASATVTSNPASSSSNPSSSSSNNSSSSSSNSSSSNSSSSNGTSGTPMPFNQGLKGDAKWLVISATRFPGTLIGAKAPVTDDSIVSSDLRSTSFWMIDGKGLAYREMAAVTADEAPTGEPSFDNAQQYLFAPQVKDILFEYFDGTNWQMSWDGTQLGGADGNTPIGPPRAIGITITLKSRTIPGATDQPAARKFKHVVALPASNAFSQTPSTDTLSGQNLAGALQAAQQLSTDNLTNAPPSLQNQNSSSSGSSSGSTTGQ